MHAVVEQDWTALLQQQDQVLSRRQAITSGLGEERWQWLVERGRWQRIVDGVAVAHSGPVTDRQRAWAAVLRGGRDAALTGDAALVEWGMRLPRPDRVEVAIPADRAVRSRRLATAPQGEVLTALPTPSLERFVHPVRRPATVRPALAVVHSVATAPTDRAGEWRLAAAVQQRLVLPSELRTVLGALPDVVRSRLIASVLDDVELGAHAASELEFLRFLRRHGLPEPDALQRPVRAGGLRYLDAWWERQRVAAEIDGVHHRDAWTWDADLLRANAVQVGQRHDRAVLLRFSVSNLRHDEAEVVRQLSLVLS